MASYYASTTGSSSNPGTQAAPWNIAKAFASTSGLTGGDIVYLTGEYTQNVAILANGTASANLTYRPWPGQVFRIRGPWGVDNLRISGNYVTVRSNDYDSRIEVTTSVSGAQRGTAYGNGVYISGDFSDALGIFVWNTDGAMGALQAGSGATFTRVVYWNVGTDVFITPGGRGTSGFAEGNYPIYVQNPAGVGDKIIEQCTGFYYQGRFHVHLYGSSAELENVKIRNCTWLGYGGGGHFGSFNKPFENFEFTGNWLEGEHNMGYGTGGDGAGGPNNGTVSNNFFFRRDLPNSNAIFGFVSRWGDVAFDGNIFYADYTYDYETVGATSARERLVNLENLTGFDGSVTWRNNLFYSRNTTPFRTKAGTQVALAAFLTDLTTQGATSTVGNTLSTGVPADVAQVLAHPAFPNWWIVRIRNFTASANNVAVNLAPYLNVGDNYKIMSGEDPRGTPVATGTYNGGTVTFKMNNTSLDPIVAYTNARQPRKMPKQLQVFHLVRTTAVTPPPPPAAVIQIAAYTESVSLSGSSWFINRPSGTTDNEVLLCHVMADDSTLANLGLPAGFTEIASHDGGTGTGIHARLGYKIAVSEPVSYTGARSATAGVGVTAHLLRIPYPAGPPSVTPTPTSTGGAGNTVIAPGLTPSDPEGLLVCFWGGVQADVDGATITWAAPGTMIEVDEAQALPYMSVMFAYQDLTSAAATGTRTATATPSAGTLSSGYRVGLSTFVGSGVESGAYGAGLYGDGPYGGAAAAAGGQPKRSMHLARLRRR